MSNSAPISPLPRRERGFILLEVMLAVAIFAMGIIGMAKCVNNCINAQIIRAETQKARLVLENRLAQIESGETKVDTDKVEKLEGEYAGMELSQKSVALKEQTENKELITGLYEIQLAVKWNSADGAQTRTLSFYVYRPQQ